jgi:hypothetical protein
MGYRFSDLEDSLDILPQASSDYAAFHDFAAILKVSTSSTSTGAQTTTPTTSTAASSTTSSNSVIADMIAHETGGVLTYAGALAVLQDAAAQTMNATLFANLTAAAKDLNVTGGVKASLYVQQIFDDVVLGNSANAWWNGGSNTASKLGNLSATSTKAQFNDLIGKWFLGTDLPGVGPAPNQNGAYATAYKTYSLPLFTAAGPQLTDVNQGQLGDCWFLAAAAETALLDPSLIKKLIISDGNGIYSVEFQVNGKADYVTVNSELPTYTGNIGQWDGSQMEFANSTTSLWVELLEKGLAQLAEQGVTTGVQFGSGSDQYYELNAGNGEGVTLLTGQACNGYSLAGESGAALTKLLGQMHTALAAGDDVMLGTSGLSVGGNLVADHMFAVTAVNASTGMVTLYNPWGANSVGGSVATSFTIAASALVADQATFYAASGATTVV